MLARLLLTRAARPCFPHRNLFIQTQPTPNPQSLKFKPGRAVLGSGTRDFQNLAQAQKESPLARTLFHIDGVSSVFLGPDFLAVSISKDYQWSLVKPSIFAAIMDFFSSGQPVLLENTSSQQYQDTMITSEDSEVVAMIKEIIETRIRPIVQVSRRLDLRMNRHQLL
jgi:hypothetical protein